MKKRKKRYLVIAVIILLIVLGAIYVFQKKISEIVFKSPNAIANPASKNCAEKGGRLEIKKRGDGGEYGVCIFNDNRQCEEWALYNGECPVGGLKVAGYITDAAVYCAIIGGKYDITSESVEVENGTCSFFNGKVCNVWDLYNGKCDKGDNETFIYENTDYNFSLNIPKRWSDKYNYAVNKEDGTNGIKYLAFDYAGSSGNLFKIEIIPYSLYQKQPSVAGDYLGRDDSDVFVMVYPTAYPVDATGENKSRSNEYQSLISDVRNIKDTFKITKPYIFPETSKETGSNYSIETMIPFVGAVESGKVDLAINVFVESIVSEFKQSVSKPDAWQGDNTLKIFYDPYELNSDFVSIRFETDEYTGEAHSDNISYSFNYDLKKEKVLGLSDVFNTNKDYVKYISDKAVEYLLKINKDDPFTSEEWIKEGAGPKEGNFKTFTISRDTIVFYLNPYQVGSYAAGMQEVIMPWSSLKDILNQDIISNLKLNM